MADLRPPRFAADDRRTLHEMLQYQRESFVRKIDGVSDVDARRALVPSGTTLLWLMQHMAHAEKTWVIGRFLGEDPDLRVDDDLVVSIATYRRTWAIVDDAVAAADLDD